MLLFLIGPLLLVLKIGFSKSTFAMPPFSAVFSIAADYIVNIRFNFGNYITILNDSYYISAFANSIYLGLSTSVLCLILGFPMAYGIHCTRRRWVKMSLIMMVALSFWTSFLVRVYSWMNLLSAHGLVNSTLLKLGFITHPIQLIGNYNMVCTGLVFCYLPFMIFPIYAVLEKVDRSYTESATDLGCTPTRVFWRITVPLSKSGAISGCIMVFTMSAGEFVIPELLGNADTITFGRVLWTEFFTNLDWPMACALSVVMMLFIILPVVWVNNKIPS
jgi:putrescine transport system permease protein